MGSCLVADFFCSPNVKRDLLEALAVVEQRTSAAICLFLERRCPGDAVDRAGEVFLDHGLEAGADQAALLLYIAVSDGKLALLALKYVPRNLGARFLGKTLNHLKRHFANGEYRRGVVEFLDTMSRELASHFPPVERPGGVRAARLLMGDLSEW